MIGARLDHWIIDREVGHGGMGIVYHAYTAGDGPNLPEQVAVKVLAAELNRDPRFQQRFQREIAALSLLEHPNIVRFYASGVHEGLSYYVMEFVEGKNFDEMLQERGKLPWQEVLDLAMQICPALKHAHDRGIVHRDLKPANLMKAADGVIKLTDFGVAKVFASTPLTATGGLVGTAEFLSPEQAAGKPATKRSDLYSLGVVLYTLLVGHPPFESASMVDLLHKHRYAQFDHPRALLPELPYEIDEVVCQMLEKDPAKRPADGLVLQKQLDRIRKKLERKATPTRDDPRHMRTRADHEPSEIVQATPPPEPEPGPATLMSRLMRKHLTDLQRGGPLAQLFNKAWVLVPLFLVCVGLLVWGLTRPRPSAEALFRGGEALMASGDPARWSEAWTDYFEPLERHYPDNAYQDQLDGYRRLSSARQAQSRAFTLSRLAPVSEAGRFYQKGLRLVQEGDFAAAQRVWRDVATAFRGVEADKGWVELAERGLAELHDRAPASADRWQAIHDVLRQTRSMKPEDAEKVWAALEDLYRTDPQAAPVLKEIGELRSRKE